MPSYRCLVYAAAGVLAAGLTLSAQSMISAQAGLVHYVEGQVWIDARVVEIKATQFPHLKENETLRTGEGRVEILLNPGAFLRLAEESAVRMVGTRLTDTRIELLKGSVMIESDDIYGEKSGTNLTVVYRDSSVQVRKNGIYRIDAEPGLLRVYSGEAEVRTAANTLVLKGGRRVALDGVSALAEKFDARVGDALTRWSRRRAEYLAMANVSGAKYIRDNSVSWGRGGWFFNPYYGMFTYIPLSGVYLSPYGCRFYSPGLVYSRVYDRPVSPAPAWSMPSWNASYGYHTVGPAAGGYSGTVAASSGVGSVSAPSTTATAAESAPVSRESGSAGGRSR